MRQAELIPTDVLGTPITVVGVGGIGSFTVLALCKMGFQNIRIYDFDVVDPENIGVQFFKYTDVGRLKVEAVAEMARDFSGVIVEAVPRAVGDEDQPIGVVVSSVDTMAARRQIWGLCKDKFQVRLVVDPRMTIESAAVFTAIPTDEGSCEDYEATLYSDAEAAVDRCTMRSTMYTPLLIAGHICKVVKDYLCRQDRDHVKVCLWNIKDNQQDCWMTRGSTNPMLRLSEATEVGVGVEVEEQDTEDSGDSVGVAQPNRNGDTFGPSVIEPSMRASVGGQEVTVSRVDRDGTTWTVQHNRPRTRRVRGLLRAGHVIDSMWVDEAAVLEDP